MEKLKNIQNNHRELTDILFKISDTPTSLRFKGGVKIPLESRDEIIKFTEEYKLDSPKEFIYLITENIRNKDNIICICGKKKQFQDHKSKRYWEFCSYECRNENRTLLVDLEKLDPIMSQKELNEGLEKVRKNIPDCNIQMNEPKYNDIIPFIIKYKNMNPIIDSLQESLYLILNPHTTKPQCPHCGSYIKFRGNGDSIIPYGIYCSTKCNNKAVAQDPEKQSRKSKSCIEYYKNNGNAAKLRGLDISIHYDKMREKGGETWDKFIKMKQRVLGKINNDPKVKLKKKETMIKNGNMTPDHLLEDKALYYRMVDRYQTNFKEEINNLENSHKKARIWESEDPNEAFHLDHIYSKYQGFTNYILPYYIGHITNLEFIPGPKNCSKNKNCGKDEKELFEDFDDYEAKKPN